jgi:hypothetical protein
MNPNLKASNTLSPISMLNSETFLNQIKKSYQADQQVKYLHLQAEIELLLHKINGTHNSELNSPND